LEYINKQNEEINPEITEIDEILVKYKSEKESGEKEQEDSELRLKRRKIEVDFLR